VNSTRRKFFAFVGGALAAPVVAKLPAVRAVAFNPALCAPYGRSPMMAAMMTAREVNERWRLALEAVTRIDQKYLMDNIDWKVVHQEVDKAIG